jgi:hypothetical protein
MEREHGEHAPVILDGAAESELLEDVRDVLLDRARGDDERVGDRLVGAALGHQPEHLLLARAQHLERARAALARDQQPDDRRVERRSALGHPPHGLGEVVDVGDAVLEQVADALGALGQQLHGVLGLGVLREHDDADARVGLADAARGAHALVGVGRRHANVDDGDVGLDRGDVVHEIDGVLGLGDDLEARVREHARDALAHESRIVGDNHAQCAHRRDGSRAASGGTANPTRGGSAGRMRDTGEPEGGGCRDSRS